MRMPMILALATFALAGCGAGNETPAEAENRAAETAAAPTATSPGTAPDAAAAGGPADATRLLVHKSPACGCCVVWADQMRAAGFEVEVRDVDDLGPIKQRLGVPPQFASCHTAEIGGYFIEGHVPAEDIGRLLARQPDARGIAVPGMPLGSPGMEVPSGVTQPYQVLLIHDDGRTEVFARHGD